MGKTPAEAPKPGTIPAILDPPLQAPETFKDGLPVPKMLVFDLDYTLWPFWVDTHVSPPLKAKDGGAKSVDRWGESFTFYPSVPPVLLSLHTLPNPPILALASRSSAPDLANTLLKQLQLRIPPPPPPSTGTNPSTASSSSRASPQKRALDFFQFVQIFPGDKTLHFGKLHKASGVVYDEMLFFDDELRNRNVEGLGVVMYLVGNGVSVAEVDCGVREWRRRKGMDGRADLG